MGKRDRDGGSSPGAGERSNLEAKPIFLRQGVDYLGFLNAKLRDLRGWATLLNELVQNADDPENTTTIRLDVTDTALIVENDGVFSDCGQVAEDRCGLDVAGDGRKCCDFHAFRRVASGHKRVEENTTGAFGIGFISVYQVTDRPALRSGRWNFVLNPESDEIRRIEATELDFFNGTRFQFPWARTASSLRGRLGLEPVPNDVVDKMCAELRIAMQYAAPFLSQLQTLELLRNGAKEFEVRCERDDTASQILVQAGAATDMWLKLEASFKDDATLLKHQHGSGIEAKKRADIAVAVPMYDLPPAGRLYATLPTEHEIELPVLINADFFPSSDRKRILFDQDYQGEWNRAAIRAAAGAIAADLIRLRDSLRHENLWRLFDSMKRLESAAAERRTEAAFATFWQLVSPALKQGEYIRTTSGGWARPDAVRLIQNARDDGSIVPLLEQIGLRIVNLDLQPFSNLLRDRDIGVRYLGLDDLTTALVARGANVPLSVDDAPDWLRSSKNRAQLGGVIERMLERVAKEQKAVAASRVLDCSIVLTNAKTLAPARQLRKFDGKASNLMAHLCSPGYWASPDNSPEILALVRPFSLQDLVNELSQRPEKIQEIGAATPAWIRDILSWINAHRGQLANDEPLRRKLRATRIWLSGGLLCSLDELAVPGDFDDPLKLARIVDADISAQYRTLLTEDLQATELTLRNYLLHHVPKAFAASRAPSNSTSRQLVALLVEHLGSFADDRAVAMVLRALPIVECRDKEFRTADHVYFESAFVSSVLGKDVAFARIPVSATLTTNHLLTFLGVRSKPSAVDISQRILHLTLEPPASESIQGVQRIFAGLAEHWQELRDEHGGLATLRSIQWLPAEGSSQWHSAKEVFSSARRYLFESQGRFLLIPPGVQRKAADFLAFLGISANPQLDQVVRHLLHCSSSATDVNAEVYTELNHKYSEPEVLQLRNKSCLAMGGGKYSNPSRAFWRPHVFGGYRVTLPEDWRRFQELLKRLEVAEEPTAQDAANVLAEISSHYVDNGKLSDADRTTVMDCWNFLSRFDAGGQTPWDLTLSQLKVVPNEAGFLRLPTDIFFEDRPGLADKFAGQLDSHVISRPEAAWRGMSRAGVRPLSVAVKVNLVECDNPIHDESATRQLADKWAAARRIFAASPDPSVQPHRMTSPELWSADRLVTFHQMAAMRSPDEEVAAFFDSGANRLYFSRTAPGADVATAREIAFGLFPDPSAGGLVGTIREVLNATDARSAHEILDEFGIPQIELAREGLAGDTAASLPASSENDEDSVDDQSSWGDYDSQSESGTGSPNETDTSGSDQSNNEGKTAEETGGDGEGEPSADGNPSGRSGSGKGGRSSGKGGSSNSKPKPRAMLRSYMQHNPDAESDDDDGLSPEALARRQEVDARGVAEVLKYERAAGRAAVSMDHDNVGFDIKSIDGRGRVLRYIEVKSMSGKWDGFGVGLSRPQFAMNQKEKSLFWLYVVEEAAGLAPKVHAIKDPASQIVQYRFDEGWLSVKEQPPEGF